MQLCTVTFLELEDLDLTRGGLVSTEDVKEIFHDAI